MTVLPIDIIDAIEKIEKAGGKVSRKTHAIYARLTVNFTDQEYPLEIITTDKLPVGTDVMVAEKEVKNEQAN